MKRDQQQGEARTDEDDPSESSLEGESHSPPGFVQRKPVVAVMRVDFGSIREWIEGLPFKPDRIEVKLAPRIEKK